ncbi:putative variant surface glycoprotein, (VSG) [Trypanosoma vivax]|nr:putative variant surface glycoprotein, (VSG) [Trypanosoma vivax]
MFRRPAVAFVGVFLTLLSASSPCLALSFEGAEGGPLLVEGAAEAICNLSGALKEVANVSLQIEAAIGKEKLNCKTDTVKDAVEQARDAAGRIDDFIKEFESKNGERMICLATTARGYSKATVDTDKRLAGCRANASVYNASSTASIGDRRHWSALLEGVGEKLYAAYALFNNDSYGSWKSGKFGAFGSSTNCTLTMGSGNSGASLTASGKRYADLWEIRLAQQEFSYRVSYMPQIKWVGANSVSSRRNKIFDGIEQLKTVLLDGCPKVPERTEESPSSSNPSDAPQGDAVTEAVPAGGNEAPQKEGGRDDSTKQAEDATKEPTSQEGGAASHTHDSASPAPQEARYEKLAKHSKSSKTRTAMGAAQTSRSSWHSIRTLAAKQH